MAGDKKPEYPSYETTRGLGLQFALAALLGVSSVLIFSMWRRKWPRLYAARTFRRRDLPPLPSSMFGWIGTLYHTSDQQVLEYAGLDAYVFLMFFRSAFDMLAKLTLISFGAIGPLRLFYTGKYDQDDGGDDENGHKSLLVSLGARSMDPIVSHPALFDNFLWVYPVFTLVFTILCLRSVRKHTLKVVEVRQQYLGNQNSITDHTIRLTGIPSIMRSKQALIEYITSLNIGEVKSAVLCYDWTRLDTLFDTRKKLIRKLERYWADYLGPTFVNEIDMENITLPTATLGNPAALSNPPAGTVRAGVRPAGASLIPNNVRLVRPQGRSGCWGIFGKKVDLIDHYTKKLEELDQQILHERNTMNHNITSTAFITMNTVHSCQMAAQALLSPRPHHLLTHLAPAPHDVIWPSIYMSQRRRSFWAYFITGVFVVATLMTTSPFYYLSRFIDIRTIKKYVPRLGDILEKSPWLETFVTQVLTTYIFTLLNIILPYFNAWLSEMQGHVSREDVELSTVSKNFFYVFINLFVVFTIGINISTWFSFPKDATKVATTLASALRRLSSFYTNLIVLQGVGIFPTRLLQAGTVLQFPFFMVHCKSARDYHELYKPASLNYGILLPTSLLIFLLALMYSILSGRILLFGALYFYIGYYVYKYQFLYSMVHPQHSTGRLWTLVVRRTFFGLALFQIAMIGILVLQSQFFLVLLMTPLPIIIAAVWYDFEKFTEPLLRFIALDAVTQDPTTSETSNAGDSDSSTGSYTLDEPSVIRNMSSIPQVDSSNMSLVNQTGNFYTDSSDIEENIGTSSAAASARHKISRRLSRTLDEEREYNLKYVNPNSVALLDGPWVGVEGNDCIIANPTGLVRRHMSFDEWE